MSIQNTKNYSNNSINISGQGDSLYSNNIYICEDANIKADRNIRASINACSYTNIKICANSKSKTKLLFSIVIINTLVFTLLNMYDRGFSSEKQLLNCLTIGAAEAKMLLICDIYNKFRDPSGGPNAFCMLQFGLQGTLAGFALSVLFNKILVR